MVSAGCSTRRWTIAHLQRRKGATDQSIIYLDPKGDNSIVSTASMAASLGTLDAEVPLAAVGPGDLLLMQGNLGLETTQGCLERARRAGCPHAAQSGADRLRLRGAVAAGRCRHRQRDRGRILAGAQSPSQAAPRLLSLRRRRRHCDARRRRRAAGDSRRRLQPVPAPAVQVVDTPGQGTCSAASSPRRCIARAAWPRRCRWRWPPPRWRSRGAGRRAPFRPPSSSLTSRELRSHSP